MRNISISTEIKSYIKDINEQLSLLIKEKHWEIIHFSRLEHFSSLVYTLEQWNETCNIGSRVVQNALSKLSNRILKISNKKKLEVYPFGNFGILKINLYKRKFDENVLETMNRFTKGDDSALFQALKYDSMSWLFNYSTQIRILMAEATGDQRFFEKLGDAVCGETKQKARKVKKDSELLYQICASCALNGYVDFNNTSEARHFCKEVYDYLSCGFEKLDNIPKPKRTKANKNTIKSINSILENILHNENYFVHKWLVRHDLRKPKTQKR